MGYKGVALEATLKDKGPCNSYRKSRGWPRLSKGRV